MSASDRRAELRRLRRKLSEIEGYLILGLPARALELLRSELWSGLTYESSLLTGEALRQLGKPRDALEHLERAATLRPLSPDLAIALGWCYKRTHRLAQAIQILEQAHKLNPEVPLLAFNLACYWSLAGDANRAVDRLQLALTLNPNLRQLLADEADLDPIRHHPAFSRLAQQSAAAPEIA